MAMTLKEHYQIKIVPAYQAADGTKFHDATEAQDFTRRKMIEAAIDTAVKANAQFARLDKLLLVDFLLMTGKHVGAVMAEPLVPVQIGAAPASLKPREHPEVPMSVAMAEHRETQAQRLSPAVTEKAAETRADMDRRFGKHPLDTKPLTDAVKTAGIGELKDAGHRLGEAMKAVDAELERQVDDDIAQALRIGGH